MTGYTADPFQSLRRFCRLLYVRPHMSEPFRIRTVRSSWRTGIRCTQRKALPNGDAKAVLLWQRSTFGRKTGRTRLLGYETAVSMVG